MGSIFALPVTFILGIISLKPSDFFYWCKWIISYVCVYIYKSFYKKRFDLYDYSQRYDILKANFINPKEEYDLESPQPEIHLIEKEDEIFFYGANSKSELLVAKINRMWNQRAEVFLHLKLATGKQYQLEKTCDFQQSCTDQMTFSCKGLQLQCTTPMRRWRLFYAGYLREFSEDGTSTEGMVYVKFALLWQAASDIYDFKTDVSTKSIADGLDKASKKRLQLKLFKLQNALDFYGQAGVIQGTLSVEDDVEDREIYLFGQRIRYLGSLSSIKDLDFQHILGYVKKTGVYFHISRLSATNVAKNFSFGFVVQSDAELKGAEEVSISLSDSDNTEKDIKAEFKTDIMVYKVNGSFTNLSSSTTDNESLHWVDFYFNGDKGYGIQFKRGKSKRVEREYSKVLKLKTPSVIPLAVTFEDDFCQLPEITGGKGSSLAKLILLSKKHSNFTVPSGMVVTTSAYQSFLTQNIQAEIKTLEEELYKVNKKNEEITKICKRIYDIFVETKFSTSLQEAIVKVMKSHFGEKIHSSKFAVRSSATGEDTEQMSAAGQMETFLGVSELDNILLAVKKCWASQFSFIASEYKRHYGQKMNLPMAVVIQEMIPCEVAGVLFTCDPLTANPTVMSITANYGLGESVVSGSEEPDMIQLRRNEKDEVSIKSVSLGAKRNKIIVEDEKGTNTTKVSEDERKVCCLSEECLLHLGNTAIMIEKHFHSRRDIEWGFYNNSLHVFQSRPITNCNIETDYEIDHEFDSAMRVEDDFHSVSNVGEVMPNAFSPLGMCVSLKSFALVTNSEEKVSPIQLKGKTQYFSKGWLCFYSHFMFNVADVFPLPRIEDLSTITKASLIGFFGRVPENKEMFEVSQARYGFIKEPNPLLSMFSLIKSIFLTEKRLTATLKTYSNHRIPLEKYNSAKELFTGLLHACADIYGVNLCLIVTSQTSSMLNMIVLMVLGSAKREFDDTVYREFATLLKTHSDVESADIPTATRKIALYISEEIKPEAFKRMPVKDAVKWLQTTQSEAGKTYRNFLEKHGHRCLQEYDVASHPWRENQEVLVNSLQKSVGSISKEEFDKKSNNLNELISKIDIPLGYFSKLFLKFILPWCRKGVQNRETSKSLMVKVIDNCRKACRSLATAMVEEGRIPEENILFYMTFDDIQELFNTRSPRIIAKAYQRKRRYPIISAYRFPEIMKGFPTPMNLADSTVVSSEKDFSMKGIPVSLGIVKGFLRKAITLEEAVHIKRGEILLTYSTDIGWSPYFPILSGVVTELGGLISHGAVVSREYGIPCIAGLHGATTKFQTGDYVVLDGNRGILQKLSPPEH